LENDSEGDNNEERLSRDDFIFSLRYFLRDNFKTLPQQVGERQPNGELMTIFENKLTDNVISIAREYSSLFVGMANGPFMPLLKADNPGKYVRYSKRRPSHKITIHWSSQIDNGELWAINPVEDQDEYTLTFKLPKTWVIGLKKLKIELLNPVQYLLKKDIFPI